MLRVPGHGPQPPRHFERTPFVLALDRVTARWSDTDAFLLKTLVIHKWSELSLRTRESDAHAAAVAILQREQETCKERAVAALLQVEQETDIALLQKTFLCWSTDVHDSKQAEHWRGEHAAMFSEVDAMAEQRTARVLDEREASLRAASLRASMRAWRDALIASKAEQEQERCALVADQRLLQADSALASGERIALARLVLAAWRGGHACDRWRTKSEQHLQQAYSMCSASTAEALLSVVLTAWKGARWEAVRRRERRRGLLQMDLCTERAFDQAVQHAEETTLLFLFAVWKETVVIQNRERETSRLLASTDGLAGRARRLSQQVHAVAGSAARQEEQVVVLACFNAWRVEALQATAQRCQERVAQRDEARATQAKRGVELTDALLVMTRGYWPRHIILTAWKHAARIGAYELKRAELQTCVEGLLQKAQMREDLHAALDGWWRVVAASKVVSERYMEAVDSALYAGQKDSCRFAVFVAWRSAYVDAAQEANMQRIRMALSLHKSTNRSSLSHLVPPVAAQGSPQSATPMSLGSPFSPQLSPGRFRQQSDAPKSPLPAGMTPRAGTGQSASSKSLLMRVLRAEGNFAKAKGTALRRLQESFHMWLLGLSLRAWVVDAARSMAEKAAKKAAAEEGEADLQRAQEAAAAFQDQLRIAQEQLAAGKRQSVASGRHIELCCNKSEKLADGAFLFAALMTWRAAVVEEKLGERMKAKRSETAAPKDVTVSKVSGGECKLRAKPLLDRVGAARSELLIAVVVRGWHEEAKESREAKIRDRARKATERLARDLYSRQDLSLLCVLFAFWRDYVKKQAHLDALAAEAWHTRLALQGDLDAIQEECQMTGLQLDELEAEFFSLQAQLTKHPVPPAVLAAFAGIQAPAPVEDVKEPRLVETQTETQMQAREEETALLRSECVLQRGKIDDLERELELLEAHLVGSQLESAVRAAAPPA